MRPRGGSSSSSSSSTSSSLLNISAKSPRFGGVFSTFFRAPSEQRKRRRRKKQKARILSFGNSSSSSLNSDLAYGRGYIERDKSQRASPTPQGYPNPALHHGDTAADIPQRPPPAPRDKTDEEILEIGRQLQDIARKQNQADLKAASKSRTSQIAGAATGAAVAAAAFSHLRPKSKSDSKTRGSGTSKPNETGSSSDDDWESASEDESTTDESDNGLVYGSAFKPAKSARISSEPPEQIKPPERRSTIVDPRLFGPVNSLRGAVKSPCGFGEEDPRSAGSSRRHHEETIAQVQSPKAFGKQPMQRIYPVPTSDPDKFDYDRSSVTSSRQDLSQRARPEPVPIQQPIPIVPVSSKVYDAERFEAEEERTKQHRLPPKGRSAAENAIAGVGVAAAAIGAAMASNRRDSGDYPEHRDDRSSEARERRGDPRDSWQSRRKEEPEQPIRIELEDRETHNHHDPRQPRRRDAVDVVDERDKRSGWSDPAYEALKRREAEPDPRSEVYRLSHGDEIRVEYDQTDDRSQPREEPKELPKNVRKPVAVDELRDAKWTEKPTESPRENHGVEQPEAPSTQAPIDPFQFQVADDAFQTPKYATPKRPLTPQVVTVDREPNFDDSPPRKPDYSDSRMSRKDSFELEQRLEKYQQGARDRSRTPEPRRRASIEEEAKHATVPIAVAAVASAIALEEERSRKHRHDQAANNGSRDSSQAAIKDAVQEEADKYYRETVIARKIAKDEIRSRSSSPHDESVVGKWQEHDDGPRSSQL
ncbi:involucrin repeat protein [Colletotrichum higginsianum]|nr:involucrin repeat protein [Colletotrichum higginsianum]